MGNFGSAVEEFSENSLDSDQRALDVNKHSRDMMLRRNWEHIDRHATQATADDASSYDRLVKYFEKIIPGDIDRDINMLRGLTYWMFYNENVQIPAAEKPADSPRKLLLDLQNEKVAYAKAYETLCTKFGIPCKVVEGISKSGSYRPGDVIPTPEEAKKDLGAFWNKVFLEGKWWPVYPRWIMKNKKPDAASQADKATFKEFWFLTDPELFIYKCYPHDIQDQMLPKSKQVKTMKKFFKLPYLTLHFFNANLKLLSEDSCIVDTVEGVAKVHFKSDKIPSRKIVFDYKLTIRERNGKTLITQNFDVPRLVLNSRNKGNFIFEVRCPEVADYTLEILGGSADTDERKLYVVTKVICREKMQNGPLLPLNAGDIGWGFGPSAIKAGLLKPNIYAPKVSIKPGKKVNFDIKLDENLASKMKYTAELIKDESTNNDDLKGHVQTSVNKNSMTIKAGVPRDGEFALVIKAGDKTGTELHPVSYYLLTTYLDEETVADDYYDSSDGTSDLDEEIDDLRQKVEQMRRKKEELVKKREKQNSSQTN